MNETNLKSERPPLLESGIQPSVAVYFMGAMYLRRKPLLIVWFVCFACFFIIALLANKKYTSSATIQIKEDASGSSSPLGEGLKMLGARGKVRGIGTTLAILESRQLAMEIIKTFHLKTAYRTKWDHLAVKKFRKNFDFETFEEGIVQIQFTHASPDSAKLILDSILAYVNRRSIEYSTSKARLEFAFNSRQLDSVYRRMDSSSATWVRIMQDKGLADLKSNIELTMKSYGALDQTLTRLEERLALSKVDERVSFQERRNLETMIASMKERRRRLLSGQKDGGEDREISILYDSLPAMFAWQEKLMLMNEKERLILRVMIPKMEESRLKMVETTPIINVIDSSFVPPYKSGPKRAFIVMFGTMVSGTLLTLLLILFEWLRNPAFVFPHAGRFIAYVRRFH